MKRVIHTAALPKRLLLATTLLLTAVLASVVFAATGVQPGTYTPGDDSFDPANAPGSSHLTSGSTVDCVVNSGLSIDCSSYALGGVGHTNANVSLVASYSATIDCFNKGKNPQNPIESQTTTFSASSNATVTSTRNGQLNVPTESVSPFTVALGCPNPNWTPVIREGTLVLKSFTYTLTFAGFASPYITITAGPQA